MQATSAASRSWTRTRRKPRTGRVQVGGLTTVTGHDQPQEPRRGQGQAPHKPRESREGAEFGDAGEGEERRCPTDSGDLPSAPHYLTALS